MLIKCLMPQTVGLMNEQTKRKKKNGKMKRKLKLRDETFH